MTDHQPNDAALEPDQPTIPGMIMQLAFSQLNEAKKECEKLKQSLASAKEMLGLRCAEFALVCEEYARLQSALTTETERYVKEAEENAALRASLLANEAAIERDRSNLADAMTALDNVFQSREWLKDGRGSYDWDDGKYQSEFADAVAAIKAAHAPLRRIVADWTNCPKTREAILEARMTVPKAALEACEKRAAAWMIKHHHLERGVYEALDQHSGAYIHWTGALKRALAEAMAVVAPEATEGQK